MLVVVHLLCPSVVSRADSVLACWCSICRSVQGLQYEDVNISQPLTEAIWDATAKRYDILVVNFFAPWCPWCVADAFVVLTHWAAGCAACVHLAGGQLVCPLNVPHARARVSGDCDPLPVVRPWLFHSCQLCPGRVVALLRPLSRPLADCCARLFGERRCQRLAPTWEAVTEEIHNKYPEADGRIRLAKVSAGMGKMDRSGVFMLPCLWHGVAGGMHAARMSACTSGLLAWRKHRHWRAAQSLPAHALLPPAPWWLASGGLYRGGGAVP